LQNLADAVNGVASGSGTEYSIPTTVNTEVSALNVSGTDLTFQAKTVGDNGTGVAASDAAKMAFEGGVATLSSPATLDLTSPGNASAALTALTTAISNVAGQRGQVGAGINQLQAASNVMNTQVQNLQSAENNVMDADVGKTVANMTQYNVLQSTGMAALQQSNQAQQAVLKLLQ
jgi:flagellin